MSSTLTNGFTSRKFHVRRTTQELWEGLAETDDSPDEIHVDLQRDDDIHGVQHASPSPLGEIQIDFERLGPGRTRILDLKPEQMDAVGPGPLFIPLMQAGSLERARAHANLLLMQIVRFPNCVGGCIVLRDDHGRVWDRMTVAC